jgi:hypothetical protein
MKALSEKKEPLFVSRETNSPSGIMESRDVLQ